MQLGILMANPSTCRAASAAKTSIGDHAINVQREVGGNLAEIRRDFTYHPQRVRTGARSTPDRARPITAWDLFLPVALVGTLRNWEYVMQFFNPTLAAVGSR
jgi:hypothetical protein